MTSDRARISYDPSRRFHGVVAQQGRVSLEADWNEAQAIAGAQLQARTLDVIGRAGSPDRGYRITPVVDGGRPTGDFQISAGTLYLGGLRMHNPDDACYSGQPDWTDHEGDPLWHEPVVPARPRELVYLLAREQEVSATEDPVLRDVALGGPDTTQRLRLVQRVIRYPTTAQTWQGAWGRLIEEQWLPRGFALNEASGSLEPGARLQVTAWHQDRTEYPAGRGGYLGPDNQFIRVQVARVDDDGVPVLVWGYDNASFLYRLSSSVAGPSDTVLRLDAAPVDAHHQPREHQAVEVLRSAAALSDDDCIAASTGLVAKVTTAYTPDSREIAIGAVLPPEYLRKPGEGLPLYLRAWEGEVRCTPGADHQLGDSGIHVRLTRPADGREDDYPVGAYWMFAIRPGVGPGARGVIYPQRIADRPQPPDGPRQWLTPLAFLRWHPDTPQAEDCVPRFDGLVRAEDTGTIPVRPNEVGGGWGLQNLIDSRAHRDRPVTICLAPGTYTLPRPLRIGPEHGRLTLRASEPGVILRAGPAEAKHFPLGMIIAADADGFALEGIEIHLAQTSFTLAEEIYLSLPDRARVVLDLHRDRVVSIGLHAARCTGLSVDGCRFIFPATTPGASDIPDGSELFGAAILSAEEVRGLRVTRCTFTSGEQASHERPRNGDAATEWAEASRRHLTIGVAHLPTAEAEPPQDSGDDADPWPREVSRSIPLLADSVLDGNTFQHLTAPLVAIGQLGEVRIERNTVRECHAGFWLVTQHARHVLTLLGWLVNQVEDADRELRELLLGALTEPLLFHATTLARTLPLALPEEQDGAARPRRIEPPDASDERFAGDLLQRLTAAEAAPQDTASPARGENLLQRLLSTFSWSRARAHQEHAAVPSLATPRCGLTISGNSIDSGEAPAIVVLDTAADSDSSLVLTANQFRARPRRGAVACLYLLRSCVVAANIIASERTGDGDGDGDRASLIVREGWHHPHRQTAVTGNVLIGQARLPPRPLELPSWESLNSVTRR